MNTIDVMRLELMKDLGMNILSETHTATIEVTSFGMRKDSLLIKLRSMDYEVQHEKANIYKITRVID